MLDGAQADLGQIKHLPDRHPDHRRQHQVGAAPPAPLGHVDDHLVRVIDPGQVRARGTGLLAGLATTTAPLARGGGRLAEPVRGRRLGGIARVPVELALQLRDPTLQLDDDRPQLNDDRCLGSHGRFQIRRREQLTPSSKSSAFTRTPSGKRVKALDLLEGVSCSLSLIWKRPWLPRQRSSLSCGRSSSSCRVGSRSWSASSTGTRAIPPSRRPLTGSASLPPPRASGAVVVASPASSPVPRARTWPGSMTLTRWSSTCPSGAGGAAPTWCWRRWSGWRSGRCLICPRSACAPSSIGPSGAGATAER